MQHVSDDIAVLTQNNKKGPKNLVHNNRPISLTSQACRVMEAILKEEILSSLQESQVIRSSEPGFLPNTSCLTNLLTHLEYVTKKVDEGAPVDTIYLDYFSREAVD